MIIIMAVSIYEDFWNSLCGSLVNKPNQDPWGSGFDPWPRSLGCGSGVAMSYGVNHRLRLDLSLLWLWGRQTAVAPIRPLAWELPHAAGAALKKYRNMYIFTKPFLCHTFLQFLWVLFHLIAVILIQY